MMALVADRKKSSDAQKALEQEKTVLGDLLNKQIQESGVEIGKLNAAISAAAERQAALLSDIQKATADTAAAAAAADSAKVMLEQEIAKLRAEIAADPAPNEKCMCLPFNVFRCILTLSSGPHCLGQIATAFFEGKTVPKDHDKALVLARKSADKHSAIGQLLMGYLYDGGYAGLQRDDAEAFRWFKLAADQNHPEALNTLGSCYFNGDGVARDLNQAFVFYQRAAGLNFSDAFVNLGKLYENDLGPTEIKVPQHDPAYKDLKKKNMVQAYLYFDKAAQQKDSRGCLNAAIFLQNGLFNEVPDHFTALKLFRQGVSNGDALCMVNVAKIYHEGVMGSNGKMVMQPNLR